MRIWWALVAAIIGAALLAVLATTPPAARGLDAPAVDFSAERAMTDVRAIARAPHPTGSADNARVRAMLAERLSGLGLTVRVVSAPMSTKSAARLAKWSGSDVVHPVVSLVATLPGRDRALPAVVLMAHYDSVWGSPGAADDGAGVAASLEVVRAIKASGRPLRDVIVLLTDGEELGLEGARAFFASDPERHRVGVVINLEARGGGGTAAMFETGRDNGAMMRLYQRAVRHPSATSLSVLIYELLPNSTDFTPAKLTGLPGFNFAFVGRPGLYHSPLATAKALDRGSLQHMGGQSLDLVRTLADVPVLPGKAPNLVFFDVFGLFVIAYPPGFGWVLVAAAGLLFAVAAWRGRARWRDVARGAGLAVGMLMLAALLLYLGNLLSMTGGKANYYDRLAAIPRLQVQALLLSFVALVGGLVLRSRDRAAGGGEMAGLALPLFALGVALQVVAPTAAFLIVWPLLLASLAKAGGAFARGSTPMTVPLAAIGTGYLLAFGFFLIQAIGPDTPSAAALFVPMIAVLAWPLVPPLSRRTATTVAALALLGAAGVALSVRFDPVAVSVPEYSLRPDMVGH